MVVVCKEYKLNMLDYLIFIIEVNMEYNREAWLKASNC